MNVKREWISSHPKQLVFQINRAILTQDGKGYEKNNDTFIFPKKFYIDRFLENNKMTILETDKTTETINQKIKLVEEQLHTAKYFGYYKMDIIQVLETFDDFCNQQKEYKDPNSLNNMFHSDYFEKKSLKKKQSKEINRIIARYNKMKKWLEELVEQKDKAYQPFNKVSYLLKAVIIHYGEINSGHYYTYVRLNDEWFRFNDITVTKVNEKTVFDDAQGLIHPYANCYCLFYSLEETERYDNLK